jgi:cell division protein FtsW
MTYLQSSFGNSSETLDTSGDGYQIQNSLRAIGSGGLFGRGYGQSIQKYLYLPESYNDFIFAIIAEELGFVGVTVVIVLFVLLVCRGYKASAYSSDKFASMVAAGISTIIGLQAVMNISVVSGVIPVTGVALPFFSYGGTSLIMIMGAMGILLNIAKQSEYVKF